MPQLLYTIDEYIATIRKKETIYIVFNKVYNDVHAFKKELSEEMKYLDKEETDFDAQKEFLDFMAKELPEVEILQVFDLASANHIIFPYLGSYAINTNIGSEAYNTLVKKYGSPYDDPKNSSAVLWIMDYKNAKLFDEEREQTVK